MVFDLSTARPVSQQTVSGFDLSTAQPLQDIPEIQQAPQALRGGRSGRARREIAKAREQQGLIDRFEAGEIQAQDLTSLQKDLIRRDRIERIPEITGSFKDLSEDLGFTQALAGLTTFDSDEFGRILSAADPDIGVTTTPEGERIAVNNRTNEAFSINKLGPSLMDAVQLGGVISAFAPAARLATGAPQLASRLIGRQVASPTGVRALGQAAGAGLTEAAIQAGQQAAGGEFDPEDVALAAGLGAAGEVLPQAIRAGEQRIRQAVEPAAETAEQAARRQLLEAEGLQPTRPQITRSAEEFQRQQSAIKLQPEGPVRARLEQQEARLQGAFEQRAVDTQGNVVTSTNTAIDEILERSVNADQRIGDLYQEARNAIPADKNIEAKSLINVFNKSRGFDTKSAGVLGAVRSILRDKGLLERGRPTITVEGLRREVKPTITVSTAEDIRQQLNQLSRDANFTGQRIIREAKSALDEDVFRTAGQDFFGRARAAVREFEQGLDRAKISKFDSRKKNLVRDILENKSTIKADSFINDVVFSKNWEKQDLNQLKLFLNQTQKGKQAWNDVRAQAIDEIKNLSFKGPLREDGVTRSLSRDALETTLKKLTGKMDVLFNAEEKAFLNRMKEVARLREPPPGTFQGGGPTEVAVNQVKNRLPIVGSLLDSLSQFRQNRLLLRLPQARRERPGRTRRVPPQSAQTLRVSEDDQ
jgi:hypothetical protein